MALYAQIDCSLPDDPKIVEAGALGELAYIRCILRCREHLTDGVIDRRVVSRWLSGIKGSAVTQMQHLTRIGLVTEHERGWCIPAEVWTKWNPTKAQVEAKKEADAERQRAYRSQRDKAVTHTRQVRESQRESKQPKPEPKPKPKETLRADHSNPLWDALTIEFGEAITASERSNRGKNVKDLAAIGATPEDIHNRVAEHARRRESWDLTANALLKHWTALTPRTKREPYITPDTGARMSEFYR